jgi:hypothetical protein
MAIRRRDFAFALDNTVREVLVDIGRRMTLQTSLSASFSLRTAKLCALSIVLLLCIVFVVCCCDSCFVVLPVVTVLML